ncbi:hypothetical protein D3C81_537270 [compost metagenome]
MKKRFKFLLVVFLIVFNISFLVPPKKSEAIVPLAIPVAYSVGTFLLTAAGYYLTQSGALDPVLDGVINKLSQAGNGAVKLYEDGKVWIAKKALVEIWDYIHGTEAYTYNPVTGKLVEPGDNSFTVSTDNVSIDLTGLGVGWYSFPFDSVKFKYNDGSGNYSVTETGGTFVKFQVTGVSGTLTKFKTQTLRSDGTFYNNTTISARSISFYPKVAEDLGKSIEVPGWRTGTPVSIPNAYPDTNIGTIPNTATDAGLVLTPEVSGTIGTNADAWTQEGVNAIPGTGSISEDGSLVLDEPIVIPGEGTGSIPTDWTTPDKIDLDFSPLYVATYKFPFCIPYDFYNLIKSFESGRRAPVWTVDFSEVANITGAGGGSFTIDMGNEYFSKFAMVFRYFLLVAFCVALYVRTKSFMGW